MSYRPALYNASMIRQTVHFSGRVQGVGFRYTTTSIAQRFAVAGYVQNLPDGRVRLVAEGEAGEVGAFIESVRERMSRYLDAHVADTSDASGEFGHPQDPDTFTVRY